MTFPDENALSGILLQAARHRTCASHPVLNCIKFANYCHPHLVNQILKIFLFYYDN